MSIDSHQYGNRIEIYTSNAFNTYRYTAKLYEKPNGDKVVVPDNEITDMVKKELEKYGQISDKRPEKYKFPEKYFTPNQQWNGKFTILEKTGKTKDISANIYKTDCGIMTTSSELETGETYETYQKSPKYFGYRKV